MSGSNHPRMIKSPFSRQQIDGKRVYAKADRELPEEGIIRASDLNPLGLMSVELVFTYFSKPAQKTDAVFRLSERQVNQLKPSPDDRYDFIYDGILKPDNEVAESFK